MRKRIVVVGAGYAGILTAKKLAKKFKKDSNIEITIIDKRSFHTMLTELHEVAAWRVEEDSIKISLERVFAGRNVKVVLDSVSSIDYEQKVVNGEASTYSYDYLVLATGSQPTFFGLEGVKEHAFTLWSYEDAVRLREHIMNVFRQASCEPDLEKKKKLLTFFTVGAGFTGVEMAGELAELVPILCRRFEIDPKLVKMVNVDAMEKVVPILPDKLATKVQRRLEKMNVDVRLKAKIISVGEDYIELQTNNKKEREYANTVIWTAGIEGSEVAKASSKLGSAGRGRIQTDEYLRSQNYKDVYIGGDNIFFIPEGEKMPVPQMVENCEACADTITHNLVCDIKKTGQMEKYAPKFHGAMVCIGGRYGVAHVGLPGKFFGLPSFLAMFSKHFINLIYFVQVLGWNKIFSYINHEFFTIRNCRSFVGGHFSNRSPSFFLVPLRIWLGIYWLHEGIVKLGQGWMDSPKLTNFFNGANAYYERLLNPTADVGTAASGADAATAATGADAATAATGADAATAATGADAATAATGADVATAATGVDVGAAASGTVDAVSLVTEAASPILFDFNLPGLLRVLFVNSGEYALKFQVPLMDSFINAFVIPNDTLQMMFQISIVLFEILIGLALIAGLFTTLSAGLSIVLQMVFLTSTGLYMSSWWMLFSGFAMMFGAGKVFSLDYYVLPWLKQRWKNIGIVKKWYLYHD